MMRVLLRFTQGMQGLLWLAVGLSSLTILSGVGLLGTSAALIVQAGFHPSIAALQVAIVGVRFFGISRSLFRYLERLVSHSANLKVLANIRQNMFRHICRSYPFSLPGKSSGEILGFLIRDIELLENGFVRLLLPFLSSALVTLIVGVYLGLHSVELALVAVIGFLLAGLVLPYLSARSGAHLNHSLLAAQKQYQEKTMDFFQYFQETLIYHQSQKIASQMDSAEAAYSRLQWRNAVSQTVFSAFGSLTIQAAALASIWISLVVVGRNQFELFFVAVFYLIFLAMFEPLQNIVSAANTMGSIRDSLRRIERISVLPASELIQMAEQPADIFPIEIKDLRFRYGGDVHDAIDGIQFSIQRNEKIAIVGRNGAGKSTFLDILAGFYPDYRGEITCGAKSLRDLAPDIYRGEIGYISNRPTVFSTTLAQNLELASPSVLPEEIREVIQKVNLATRFEDKNETLAAAEGVKISAGEGQKIEIARSLLRKNRLLLLDEPFSSLDPLTASRMRDLIHQAFNKQCVVWVTHDLQGMDWFDRILVFDKGKIVEQGTHRDLIASGGLYAEFASVDS